MPILPLPSSSLRRALSLAALAALLATAAPAVATRAVPGCGREGTPSCLPVTDHGPSRVPRVSGNGRYVTFDTFHDLTNDGKGGLYRLDLLTGATDRVNVDDDGERNDRYSVVTAISGDGDRVLFSAAAPHSSLSAPFQLYVREFSTGRTVLASANTAGGPTEGWMSPWAVISADGRFVAFAAQGGDLVAGDRPTGYVTEVYLRDLTLGTTARVSYGQGGLGQNTNTNAGIPRVSAGGRYVGFTAIAGLIPEDTDNSQDVYVRDMQTGQL